MFQNLVRIGQFTQKIINSFLIFFMFLFLIVKDVVLISTSSDQMIIKIEQLQRTNKTRSNRFSVLICSFLQRFSGNGHIFPCFQFEFKISILLFSDFDINQITHIVICRLEFFILFIKFNQIDFHVADFILGKTIF